MSNLKIEDYLDNEKVEKARKQIASSEKSGILLFLVTEVVWLQTPIY